MGKLKAISWKAAYIVTSILAAICLFTLLSSYNINRTVLDEDFHRELFEKNDIYDHTYEVIDISINDLIGSVKQYYPQDFDKYQQVFGMIKSSVTPELVKYNLDSVRNELFQYFKGEKRFLPDIYLRLPSQSKPDSVQVNSSGSNSSQSAISVDRINLSAILLYTNRTDISDKLFVVRFIYYMLDSIPGAMLMLFLIFMLAGIYLCRNRKYLKRWLQLMFLSCGLPLVLGGAALLIYIYGGMPKAVYPLVLSLPVPRDVIVSYIRDSFVPASIWILFSGLLFISFAILLRLLPGFQLPGKTAVESSTADDKANGDKPAEKKPASAKRAVIIRNIAFGLAGVVLFSLTGYKAYALRKDFEKNDFAVAVSKMKGTDTVMEVIAAQDKAIYTLQVKVVDKEDGQPMIDIPVNIVGKSEEQEKGTNIIAYTDETGIARFTLDKGTFRAGFLPSEFPKEYTMPSPYFFEMKTPGTTMITINLDTVTADENEKWGVVEIEVLDSSNNPVSDLELEVTENVSAPGDPGSIYSITNAEGIAVFKLNQGDHTIGFVTDKFPVSYENPPVIKASVVPDAAVRYTIRLVDKGLHSAP